jgi:hypothetical protein
MRGVVIFLQKKARQYVRQGGTKVRTQGGGTVFWNSKMSHGIKAATFKKLNGAFAAFGTSVVAPHFF